MDQDIFRRVHPREYLKRFLVNDVRPDGRSPNTPRNLKITTGSINTAVGSAMIKLGSTTTVAGIDATVVQPSSNTPDQGALQISVELLSTASATSRFSRVDDAQVLTDYLRSLIDPHIDLTRLCLDPGNLVWNLHLSVYCIDNDGNLEDAMLIAAVAALQNVLLPSVRLVEDLERPLDEDTGDKMVDDTSGDSPSEERYADHALVTSERTIPLEMDGYPLSVSFSLFDDKTLIDPSAEEETAGDSRITLVMRPSGELRAVLKPGGKHMSETLYKSCLTQALHRVPYLVSKVTEANKARSTAV